MNVAIITGASSGLGVEFLNQTILQRKNIDEIWLIARRTSRLEELSKNSSVFVRPISLDLTLDESYKALEDLLNDVKPNVSLLINNAGVGKMGYTKDSSIESQIMMIDLNCKGLTAMTTLCLKFMSKGSEIINVCSIASFVPNTRLNTYSATKAYVLSFTKGLREELKRDGINCLCVCPGPMETEFLAVADITPGSSKTFETLPYCNAKRVAEKTLKASSKKRCVYTPKGFYKLYRVLAKLLPHSLMMKLAKV